MIQLVITSAISSRLELNSVEHGPLALQWSKMLSHPREV